MKDGLFFSAAIAVSAAVATLGIACTPTDPAKASHKENQVVTDDRSQLPVVTDEATGCQYLGYVGHGITPRMTKAGGNYHHMGCR